MTDALIAGAMTQTSRDSRRSDLMRLRDRAFRTAYAIVNDRELAEDVTQEALIRAMEKVDGSVVDLAAWLRIIVVRTALNSFRKGRPNALEVDGPSIEAPVDERLQIELTLGRLSPEQRAILALAYHEGLSYREISEILNVPEGTVSSRLSAAKQAFQQEYSR